MSTATKGTNMIAEMMEIINRDEYAQYGMRVMSAWTDEEMALPSPQVGDVLPASRLWDDNEVVVDEDDDEVFLDGTCAIHVYDMDRDRDMTDNVSLLDSYIGRYVVLLGSNDHGGYGTDLGEIILREPKVLAVWDRGE